MWKWRSTYSISLWDNEGGKTWKKFNWKKRQLPISKNTMSCFASSSHRAQNHIFRKLLPWCPGQSPKMKRIRDRSCCLFSKHGEDLCTKSEQSKETASSLTTIAVTTSHHTGNWPGAPELKTQPYSWTYKSSALKGCKTCIPGGQAQREAC